MFVPFAFSMNPTIQEWRDHLSRNEAEQLLRLPLHEPSSSLEQAQFSLAQNYLTDAFPLHNFSPEEIYVFRADDVTRLAFYQFFQQDAHCPFCLRFAEWNDVLTGDYFLRPNAPLTLFWHVLKPYTEGNWDQDNPFADPVIEDYPPETLFIRSYGTRWGPLAAHSSTNYWHWNDMTLVHLSEWDYGWVS